MNAMYWIAACWRCCCSVTCCTHCDQSGEILMNAARISTCCWSPCSASPCCASSRSAATSPTSWKAAQVSRCGSVAASRRCCIACAASKSRKEMSWKQYAIALLLFNVLGAVVVYALQRLQFWLAVEPAEVRRRQPGLLVQHGRQLHHQHELAGLLRRVDDGLPGADGGACRAEFPVRRNRHRGRHRADTGLRPPHRADHRQFLGRHDALHSVRAAAAVGRAGAGAGEPGRHPELLDGYKESMSSR
jgi:hypothetical protein